MTVPARRPATLLATLLAVGALLAGCAAPATTPGTPEPSPSAGPGGKTKHVLGAFKTMKIASFDGTLIHVDLQFPDGNGPFPTLLTYTPYSALGEQAAGAQADLGSPFAAQWVSSYVPDGYVVGVAHVRGTGESGGCLTVGGPEEGLDGAAIVEALAAEPWSNGKVAMAGTSWDGTTPLETAIHQPPHLAAVVAISPVTSWYRYYFETGAHRRNGDTFPGSSDTDPAFDVALGGTPGPRTQTVEPTKLGCIAEFTAQDDLQDDYNAYWAARDHGAHAANITAPVLYAQGWFDENVATTMVPDFWANLDRSAAPHHAWLEQHAHGEPASKKAFYAYMHQFLDHYLLGIDNGAEHAPAVIVEDNNHQYRTESTWPPTDVHALRFNLSADNTLMSTEEGVPSGGSMTLIDAGTGLDNAVTDQRETQQFTSKALPALHLAGVARLHLTLSTNMPATQVDVLLYDVAPDGTPQFLTRGYLDFKHRDSITHADPVMAGVDYGFTMDLHPRDHRMAAGDHLRLVVKATDDYVVRSPYRAINTMTFDYTGEKAWLEIPVVDDSVRAFSDSAPAAPTPA